MNKKNNLKNDQSNSLFHEGDFILGRCGAINVMHGLFDVTAVMRDDLHFELNVKSIADDRQLDICHDIINANTADHPTVI